MENLRLIAPSGKGMVNSVRYTWCILFGVLFFCVPVYSADLYLWSENHKSAANVAMLKLALSKAESRYGKINLRSTSEANYEQAFNHLYRNEKGFDLIISALDKNRESALLPVYFPLDRGLLGFRLCIISQHSLLQFAMVSKHSDLSKNALAVTVDPSWPDLAIMKFNHVPVKPRETHLARLNLVRNDDSVCYSRSIIEIDNEIEQFPELEVEHSFVMIYPQADILYFRKGAGQLAEAVEFGLEQAYQDGSFLEVFDSYYAEIKKHYSLYDRKLFIMPSPILSEKGREAVNRFGLFSFVKQPNG